MSKQVYEENEKIMKKFKESESEASEVLKDPEQASKKLQDAFVKLEGMKDGPITVMFEDIKLMIDIIKDYINGSYKQVPQHSIIAIFGGLIYFLSPIDVIPDFIPGVGYIDDAFVIALVLKQVHEDLQNYKIWKQNQ
ncbi:MAG: hypothetical protein BGO41_09380 [Clostridiales bacterium 38-18]|nr:MAG: hypothetical protein BGO41_09380 [Clostridiales bacterium 38-18]